MKLLLWCCKWLGYQTLETFLSDSSSRQKITIVGLVVSRRDTWMLRIEQLAKAHNILLFYDLEPITVTADLGLCIGFPHKLAAQTLKHCQRGVINLHFAPLPAYRGSGTLTWAIINQEKAFGVTLHWMDEELDTGRIIDRSYFSLSDELGIAEIEKQLEQHAWQFLNLWLMRVMTNEIPEGISQVAIVRKTGIKPQLCTRASVRNLYHLSSDWPDEKVVRYLRALPIKKDLRPFFKLQNRRVFLELEAVSHNSHTDF